MTDPVPQLFVKPPHGNSLAAKAALRAEEARKQAEIHARSVLWPEGWTWTTSPVRIEREDGTREVLQLQGWSAPLTQDDLIRRAKLHARRSEEQ